MEISGKAETVSSCEYRDIVELCALECCNMLQDELQAIVEMVPADKNRYTQIVLEIEKEFNLIKRLRQSDNRFLKNLKDSQGNS